jgi:hypothetical protein
MDISGALRAVPPRGREIQVWLEVKLSTRERFDDQHGARADGTMQQVRCFGAICACHCAIAADCVGVELKRQLDVAVRNISPAGSRTCSSSIKTNPPAPVRQFSSPVPVPPLRDTPPGANS